MTGVRLRDCPWQIAVLAVALVCPTELSLFLGGLRLPPHRVALIVLAVVGLVRLARKSPIRPMAADAFLLIYGLWSTFVYMYHEGEGPGLQYGGSLALESTVAYFVARMFITNARELVATVRVLFTCLLVVGSLAVAESISHYAFVHAWLKQVTGFDVENGFELRNGLMRAYSTFDHPILYGSFCASLFALTWATATSMRAARVKASIVAFVTYFGLSSAPLLCLGVQVALLAWERLSRGVPRRALLTIGGIVAALFMLGLVSNRSPFAIIATGFTLDPWTGFYRLLIWRNGLENVERSPWFGIGLGDWTREWWMFSDSIDAFWLVTMMRMGVPALVFLLAGLGCLLWAVHNQRVGMNSEIRRMVIAWTFSVIALSLAGCTVHYWNNVHAYFFFTFGIMAWVGDSRLARARAAAMARGVSKVAPAPHKNGADRQQPSQPLAPTPTLPLQGGGRPVDGPRQVSSGPTDFGAGPRASTRLPADVRSTFHGVPSPLEGEGQGGGASPRVRNSRPARRADRLNGPLVLPAYVVA